MVNISSKFDNMAVYRAQQEAKRLADERDRAEARRKTGARNLTPQEREAAQRILDMEGTPIGQSGTVAPGIDPPGLDIPLEPIPVVADPLLDPAAGRGQGTTSKYIGGGLGQFAREQGERAAGLEAPTAPPRLPAPEIQPATVEEDAPDVREPLFVSEQARLEAGIRSQQFERQEAEREMRGEMLLEEEKINRLQDDVSSYNVDPGYFWNGRRTGTYDVDRGALQKGQLEIAKKRNAIAEDDPDRDRKLTALDKEYTKLERQTRTERTAGGFNIAQKIGLIISSAIMARSSALLGQDPMSGIKAIQGFIDRNMQMQQMELGRRKGLVSARVNFLGEMRSKFKDQRAADLQTRASLNQSLAGEIAKAQTKVKNANDKQKLVILENQVKMEGDRNATAARALELNARKAKAEQQYRSSTIALERQKLAAAKTQKSKKIVGSAVAKDIGNLDAGIEMITDLGKNYNENVGFFSSVTQAIPGTTAKDYNDARRVTAQTVGGILEGGKLTDQDYERYYDMLPNPGDTSGRATLKLKIIADLLRKKRLGTLKSLGQAGHDISGYMDNQPVSQLGEEKSR